MKYLIFIFITIFNLTSYSQLVIYATTDATDRFSIDTIKVSGDSTFINVSHIIKGKVVHKEGQINIRIPIKATTSNCNGDSGKGLKAYWGYQELFHGSSEQWYLNGQLKCKGTFTFDKKNPDWKYWDETGKEIPEPPADPELINCRGRRSNVYYIDGVRVDDNDKRLKRKKNK